MNADDKLEFAMFLAFFTIPWTSLLYPLNPLAILLYTIVFNAFGLTLSISAIIDTLRE